ncbi:unnamed protein product [Candidula unifasciata]|uniref:Uncharacterized protein n=1 Tax=Candidula unifasciata TaxID=100452 RepID=A0A8S4ACH9_9EUPU|nr:unnamed protein product [Candidula unifasciata]
MESFDLTFHEVTSDESLNEASSFDSFSSVVNYETYFDTSDKSLPQNAYNLNTAQYSWKDYTYPSTASIQTTNGGVPTGPNASSVQHQPVWSDPLHGSPPHRSFLVHPDDSLSESKGVHVDPASPTVTIAQLQVLAQVSSNTSAVTKGGRRTQRFVARTVTSPSTPIPPTALMAHQSGASPIPASAAGTSSSAPVLQENAEESPDDSSFETVAEALRLQWSVIGNKSLTPASPDVVAQIVAEAERKMKAGNASPLPQAFTPATSPTPLTNSSSTPVNAADVISLSRPLPSVLQEVHRDDCPRELMRIIPKEITKEKSQTNSWFSSGAKSPDPSVNRTSGINSPVPKTSKTTTATPSVGLPAGTVVSHNQEVHQKLQTNDNITFFSASASKTASTFVPVSTDSTPMSPKGDISDTFSEASYSSELEMEKYLQGAVASVGISTNYQLECEEFLKSLPPIKPINLEAYAAIPLLPPRSEKLLGKKQKLTAAKAQISNEKTTQSESEPSTPTRKGSSTSLYSAESPTQSTKTNSTSGTPLLTRMADFYTPDSKIDLPSHQLSPEFSTENRGTSTPNQSPYTHSTSPGGISYLTSFSKKHFDELLKEKARLHGQLEILSEESQIMLQERTELQAQLATLKSKLASWQKEGGSAGDGNLRKEVENLRLSRKLLEQTIVDANRMLCEKAEEVRAFQDELQVAQDTANRLQVRSQEMRDDIRAKDMNVQALKNKIAELYVEVQTSIQAKMEAETEARTSRNDLMSLVKAKEWYQEQLQLAHDVRAKLQRELTILQAQAMSHGTIVERLKSESARLRHQLSETQQRALQDKELLARHLEGIQSDMMERESAFLEIQRERKLYEDTFNYQVTTAEEEKSRLAILQQATNELEAQLDRAHTEAKRRHEQLISMETGQMDVMKRLAVAEETLADKEKSLEEMEQRMIQMESQLQAVMSDLTKKDQEILSLKEEKANTEIALRSALQEKASVDKALEILKSDMGRVEKSFKQMKQELNQRLAELELARLEKEKLQEEVDRTQHELELKSRSMDTLSRDVTGRSAAQHGLEAEKAKLEEDLHELQLKMQHLEYMLTQKEQSLVAETGKVNQLSAKVTDLEAKLEIAKDSVPVDKVRIYENEIELLRLRIRALEETEIEEASALEKEKEKMQAEITRLKEELLQRQKAYDENLDVLDRKLKELTDDKQQLETELGIAQRSEELSQLEERDSVREEIQSLTNELRSERQGKHELEQRLLSLQASKAAEIEALQKKLDIQSETLQALQSQQTLLADLQLSSQNLELELEKEKGRVLGLSQTNAELKEHSHQLEAALAQRESALESLKRSVEESTRDLDQRDQKFLDRISSLEEAVEKEFEVQRELRKQMGTKIMENKRLKKQNDSIKMELEQLRQDLAISQQTAVEAMAELETANKQSQSQLTEARENSALVKSLEAELDRVKRDLNDNLARQPVLLEQIQSLQWECAQKVHEVEAAKEQIKIAEERAQGEIGAAKASLQEKQSEIDRLQAELASLRQEKKHQRSQVNELRGALKASVQHHKLTKRLNENDTLDKGVQANIERKVVIPPLPFDLAVVEQLIQDTRVTPLDSKPLDQLSVCLSSLRAEINGLQKQMDRHTTAVHTSSQSWKTVQKGVSDLNEVMKTIANTIIAANSTPTTTVTSASDRERTDILHV